ncbi:hypothetical protein pipiens_017370 [Culex pipiens pipiens]|uniref:Chitin-binding type-2 domain-containing protein n=1 Tax=Culex pipiens pipiens TaxID=38569 RepID=A0ABD1CGY7_CULPP
MFNGRFVVGWLGLLVLTGYVQSAIPLGQLGRASSKASSKENTSTNVCKGQKDGTKFPDMKNCSKYIRCEKSKETSKSCEGSKSFDAVSLACVKSSGAVCFQAPAPTTELPIVEDPVPECFSVSEADCGAYYDCNGEAHWERCLEGYIYYPKLRSCLPGNVETCQLYSLE